MVGNDNSTFHFLLLGRGAPSGSCPDCSLVSPVVFESTSAAPQSQGCWLKFCKTCISYHVVTSPAATVSPGNCSEMQILSPHHRLTESGMGHVWAHKSVFNKPSRGCWSWQSLRTTGLGRTHVPVILKSWAAYVKVDGLNSIVLRSRHLCLNFTFYLLLMSSPPWEKEGLSLGFRWDLIQLLKWLNTPTPNLLFFNMMQEFSRSP